MDLAENESFSEDNKLAVTTERTTKMYWKGLINKSDIWNAIFITKPNSTKTNNTLKLLNSYCDPLETFYPLYFNIYTKSRSMP